MHRDSDPQDSSRSAARRAPLPREEPPAELGDLAGHDAEKVRARAELAGLDLQAAGNASLLGLVGQFAEHKRLTSDALARNANAIARCEEQTARRVDRLGHQTRQGLAELRAQILELQLSQYRTDIDAQQERKRLEDKLLRTEREAREAGEDASEDITGQFRRPSHADQFLEDAARQGLAIAAERQKVEIERARKATEIEHKDATLTIEVRAERSRTWIRVAGQIALIAFGTGGWVWIALMRGCGG